jgi:hypothetical protein
MERIAAFGVPIYFWPLLLPELLDKAHHDVSEEEDNAFAQGLQERALPSSRVSLKQSC